MRTTPNMSCADRYSDILGRARFGLTGCTRSSM